MELPNYTIHTHSSVLLTGPSDSAPRLLDGFKVVLFSCMCTAGSVIHFACKMKWIYTASHHTTHVICTDDWPLKCVAAETLLCLWCERVQITRRARLFIRWISYFLCAHNFHLFIYLYYFVLVSVGTSARGGADGGTFLLWRFIHTRETTAKRKISWKRWFCSTEKTAT